MQLTILNRCAASARHYLVPGHGGGNIFSRGVSTAGLVSSTSRRKNEGLGVESNGGADHSGTAAVTKRRDLKARFAGKNLIRTS
jgi:hypothetical protein